MILTPSTLNNVKRSRPVGYAAEYLIRFNPISDDMSII